MHPRRAGAIVLAVLVGLSAVVGLALLLGAHDSGRVRAGAAAGPGAPVPGGAPPGLSPALRRSLARGDVALAWRRRLAARSPADPALRGFAEYWLGRGDN